MNKPVRSLDSWWKLLAAVAVMAVGAACITINVYFPEAAVKDLSQKIEEAVVQEAERASDEAPEDASSSGTHAASSEPTLAARWRAAVLPTLAAWTASPLQAAEVAGPAVTNPAIRKIVESRGRRLPEILPFKTSGVLGENKDALLEIRDLASLALKDRAVVQRLVKDENADRERMFKEIAAATGADLSSLSQIQATYAETLRENASPGDWIQMPDGGWKQK